MENRTYLDHLADRFMTNILLKQPQLIRTRADASLILQRAHTLLGPLDRPRVAVDLMDKLQAALDKTTTDESRNGKSISDEIKLLGEAFSEEAPDDMDLPRVPRLITVTVRFSVEIVRKVVEDESSRFADDTTIGRIREIGDALGLSDSDLEIIQLAAVVTGEHGVFDDHFDDRRVFTNSGAKAYLNDFLMRGSHERQHLSKTLEHLSEIGVIELEKYQSKIKLNDDILAYIEGQTENSTFLDAMFETYLPESNGLLPVSVSDKERDLVQKLIETPGGVNILFYGSPGTGKTTLARSVCGAVGARILSIRNPENGDQSSRVAKFLCARKIAAKMRTPAVILVDEADMMLGTKDSYFYTGGKSDKGWLNKTLDATAVKIIWVTNDVSRIEDSTMRRFAFSLEFKNYTSAQRRKIWKAVRDQIPELNEFITDADIDHLSTTYHLQPAHIVDSARHVMSLKLDAGDRRGMLERCLASFNERLHGSRESHDQSWTPTKTRVSATGLNTDIALATVLDSARQFYRMNADDESARDTSRPINFNILLSGPPGTGKTEFAKSLAQDLGRDLIVKSASDLLSMWVGGTEKQIAGAFRDAEAAKAILFIDEADTFLFSRGSAGRGWEVSQVNEFLCRMERFKGILICASNHMDNFDSAAIRRFAVKVRFDWLKNDGKEMFFSTCFAPLFARLPESCRGPAILNTKQQSRLESINCLAPGDFKVAYQQHAFRDLTEMDTELLTDNLLAALATEVSYKRDEMGRKIGF